MKMLHYPEDVLKAGSVAATLVHVVFLIPGLEFFLSELEQWSTNNLRV